MAKAKLNLLKSIIHITKERDKRSLEIALLEVLTETLEFDAAILLHFSPHIIINELEVITAIPNNPNLHQLGYDVCQSSGARVSLDKQSLLCIENQQPSSNLFNGTIRTQAPIVVNNVVTGLLNIHGLKFDDYTNKMISNFLKIYSNFQAVLDDNERDTLTSLLNRKAFDTHISEMLANNKKDDETSLAPKFDERRSHEDNEVRWIGMLDIDHFKTINDNYGHLYGDEVLMLFANIMRSTFRKSDILFRYGGEEFVVVLAPTSSGHAYEIFERFRTALAEYDFPQVGRVTASIGIAQIRINEYTTTVIDHADKALYFSKDNGRNQTSNYHDLLRTGKLDEITIKSNVDLF